MTSLSGSLPDEYVDPMTVSFEAEQWLAVTETSNSQERQQVEEDFRVAQVQVNVWSQGYGGFDVTFSWDKTRKKKPLQLQVPYHTLRLLQRHLNEMAGDLCSTTLPHLPRQLAWWLWTNANVMTLCDQMAKHLRTVAVEFPHILFDVLFPDQVHSLGQNELEAGSTFRFSYWETEYNKLLKQLMSPERYPLGEVNTEVLQTVAEQFSHVSIEYMGAHIQRISKILNNLEDLDDLTEEDEQQLAILQKDAEQWSEKAHAALAELRHALSLLETPHPAIKLKSEELVTSEDTFDYLAFKANKTLLKCYVSRAEAESAALSSALSIAPDDIEVVQAFDHAGVNFLQAKREERMFTVEYLRAREAVLRSRAQLLSYQATNCADDALRSQLSAAHENEYKRHEELSKSLVRETLLLKKIEDALKAHHVKHAVSKKRLHEHTKIATLQKSRQEKQEQLLEQQKDFIKLTKERIRQQREKDAQALARSTVLEKSSRQANRTATNSNPNLSPASAAMELLTSSIGSVPLRKSMAKPASSIDVDREIDTDDSSSDDEEIVEIPAQSTTHKVVIGKKPSTSTSTKTPAKTATPASQKAGSSATKKKGGPVVTDEDAPCSGPPPPPPPPMDEPCVDGPTPPPPPPPATDGGVASFVVKTKPASTAPAPSKPAADKPSLMDQIAGGRSGLKSRASGAGGAVAASASSSEAPPPATETGSTAGTGAGAGAPGGGDFMSEILGGRSRLRATKVEQKVKDLLSSAE